MCFACVWLCAFVLGRVHVHACCCSCLCDHLPGCDSSDSGGCARKSVALSLILSPMKRVQSSPNLATGTNTRNHTTNQHMIRNASRLGWVCGSCLGFMIYTACLKDFPTGCGCFDVLGWCLKSRMLLFYFSWLQSFYSFLFDNFLLPSNLNKCFWLSLI